jgi:signal transduction histidine kinase
MGLPMANAQQPRRIKEVQADREALEHIARMLEGRVLRGPGLPSSSEGNGGLDELILSRTNISLLLEAMPAAIGILSGSELVHANSAFAYAFGYRSFAELRGAGGLDAIVPGRPSLLALAAEAGRSVPVDTLTRGRRRFKASFDMSRLDGDGDLKLIRLIDPAGLDAATPASTPPVDDAPATANAVAETKSQSPSWDPAQAARRLDFLAKVSHEVRTPLNSILGFTELMLEERFGVIGNPRYKGYIEDVHQSGLYALSLLNDLLDISKIEAGKFELDFTAVDALELVEECVNSLQPIAKRERILLRTSLPSNLPGVLADRRRLKQILLNLLSNAIKFTKQGGQVIVGAKLVEGGELRLRVHDNGVGMTSDEIGSAMQPFHQLDTSPRNQTGTGLGLPLTKALVDAHRAKLVIMSARGAGTSADVLFPRDRLVEVVASA